MDASQETVSDCITKDLRLSFGARVGQLASESPEETPLICVNPAGEETVVSYLELERRSNQIARLMLAHSPAAARFVLVALPNNVDHVLVTLAGWKLGACVLPLNPRATIDELSEVAALVGPALFVGDVPIESPQIDRMSCLLLATSTQYDNTALPDRISVPGKAVASGGSTGRPKIIVDPTYWAMKPGELVHGLEHIHLRADQTQLICGPLFHNMPLSFLSIGLFERHCIVLMERFDAGLALRLIESRKVEWAAFVPTMMKRMSEHPLFATANLTSLEGVFHTAGPCPSWVKEKWMDRIGPERVVELYGAAEEVGFTIIRGDEWIWHRGSVGRGFNTEIRILRGDGSEASPGEVGEVYLKRTDIAHESFHYLGSAAARRTADGFTSVGDLGSVDESGYLFLADRRADLIISGGVNVYPAEVEGVLSRYPGVRDVAVIGLPDADWGQRVHAVIEVYSTGPPPIESGLHDFCIANLAPDKRPKSYTIGMPLPRNEAGKLRRVDLADAVSKWSASQSSGQV